MIDLKSQQVVREGRIYSWKTFKHRGKQNTNRKGNEGNQWREKMEKNMTFIFIWLIVS